jgi:hypothetical protein
MKELASSEVKGLDCLKHFLQKQMAVCILDVMAYYCCRPLLTAYLIIKEFNDVYSFLPT